MPSVLCLQLVNIYITFSILYMLYRLLMAGRAPDFRQGRGRPRKHGLPLRTCAPPTASTAPVSTTPTTATTSTPPGHPPHTQEFVMIPNPRYVESGPQPSFPSQPSPPSRSEARTLSVPGSTPSFTPSQLSSQGGQASLSTPSQGSMNQCMEFRYDGKSLVSNFKLKFIMNI